MLIVTLSVMHRVINKWWYPLITWYVCTRTADQPTRNTTLSDMILFCGKQLSFFNSVVSSDYNLQQLLATVNILLPK